MTRNAVRAASVLVVLVAGLCAQSPAGAGPAPASPASLGAPKPFPYAFKLSRPPAEELAKRRAALAKEIGDGAVVVVSAEKPGVSRYRYAPDNNVYYLTGIDTDFCALILVAKDGKVAESSLFLPIHDDHYELWDGKRIVAGDEAKQISGIDDVVKIQDSKLVTSFRPFEERLKKLAAAGVPVYCDGNDRVGRESKRLALAGDQRTTKVREFLKASHDAVDIRALAMPMTALRGVKSEWEIGMMREAIRITGGGFVRALRQARPLMWEFDFQSVMTHAFDEAGCTGVPYFPIAASGPNACAYHYVENRRQIRDGEVVLCDIAAEWGYYAADITRSFPVNGKFTERQKLVYEAVLAGQTAAARALKPGTNLGALNQIARRAMKEAGLKEHEMHQHGLGHHIGLYVHDLGGPVMEPGMIITIEPGAYIESESLGIRIEDMYLVTEDGAECLSTAIPKTVAEIEALVGAAWR